MAKKLAALAIMSALIFTEAAVAKADVGVVLGKDVREGGLHGGETKTDCGLDCSSLRIPTPSQRRLLDQAIGAFQRGDYNSAAAIWRPLAEEGVARAAFNLGYLYDRGWGVAHDDVVAARWYRAAADQGDPHAEYNLAVFFGQGRGVARDFNEAIRLDKLAAEQGYADAAHALGMIYSLGIGAIGDHLKGYVPPDHVTGYMWFALAVNDLPQGAARDREATYLSAAARRMTVEEIDAAELLMSQHRRGKPAPN